MAEKIPTEEESFKMIMLTVAAAWRIVLSKSDIERWLRNFTGDVFSLAYEREIALLLLSNFVYYNIDEVRHLCRVVFRGYLRRLLAEQPQQQVDPAMQLPTLLFKTAFCPLGKPGESGSQILYYFRQENSISMDHLSQPDTLPAFAEYVAFLDDATISGTQALQYLRRYRYGNRRVFLLSFLSTRDAAEMLSKAGITVISSITLDDRSRCFSNESTLFRNFNDSYKDCHLFATKYGEKALLQDTISCDPLGFEGGGYSFGFFYNTPDNSLPIFWADNGGWSPIMRRYHKLKGEVYREYGEFI